MTEQEIKLFTDVNSHYEMSEEDLHVRRDTFNTADELFRSHIDESNWPYSSLIFIPTIFTSIFEKTSRLIGNKPKGRLIPREGGDVLGAKINNEILSFQWDDARRIDGMPMVAKWAIMDMNARKYGASFALVPWHYERKLVKEAEDKGMPTFKSKPWFDGPGLEVLLNRDSLHNPSYSTIKNWFQVRKYQTLVELLGVNDVARGAPIYKNLEKLREMLKKDAKVTDTRETNYQSRNKSMKGLNDFLGRDETNRVIEVVTEYRDNRWITFAPKHGLILRDIENPYNHQEIPIVHLRYYPIDDDIYGIPEWEPVEKLQKAQNAISSQYIDAVNVELNPIIGVDSTRVRMHTLQFTPRAKWITTGDPRTAVVKMDFSAPNSVGQYRNVFSLLKGEMSEALGETSANTSQLNTFGNNKTATEIKDLSAQRLARDNFNQLFLSEAIKRQMCLWYSMNKQFFFDEGDQSKIIRIVGKDAISYFRETGLDQEGLSEDTMNDIQGAEQMGVQVDEMDYMQPIYPVDTDTGVVPKMKLSSDGQFAELHATPSDMEGDYDYIADIESMQPPNNEQIIAAKKEAISLAIDPNAQAVLQSEGKKTKLSELMEDYFEQLGFKDAAKYFENIDVNSLPMQNGQTGIPGQIPPNQGGAVAAGGMPTSPGVSPQPGLGQAQDLASGANQPYMA